MIKKNTLRLLKFIPINFLKIFLYKKIFGFEIGNNVKIGKTIINCKKVTIKDNVVIESNSIISCNELYIGENSKILSENVILGSGNFKLGSNSRIINKHYFDLWNNIEIGNNSWIAGKGSQFWTHGSLKTKANIDLSIYIGDDVYVGSAVKFSPGAKIGNKNLVALGAVVTGEFLEEKNIIAGNLASIIKREIYWRDKW